eukprot:CAMPEP_0167819282 /NCGR_PEP_ID=MMETSP0112_2-20121227/5307_1 /TAXON_ID=91324 /ORGANISM="Lotharella globosa, Strain CCCM811" /LENGTH=669 /DNA_ID=CAMNT_0007719427 /DNA_START=123 /DNA_END=2132 /DNA_ORIENTATION=-
MSDSQWKRVEALFPEMEGWMEKRSKMGFWQPRFFRFKPEHESLVYFAGNFDTKAQDVRGELDVHKILEVERIEKRNSPTNSFYIKFAPGHGFDRGLYLRCGREEDAIAWLRSLQVFAKSWSPLDTIRRSALSLVFSDEMIREFNKLLVIRTYAQGEAVIDTDSFYLLKEGKIGVYVRNREGKEQFYCDTTPVCLFNEMALVNSIRNVSSRRQSARVSVHKQSSRVVLKAKEKSVLMYLPYKNRTGFLNKYGGVCGRLDVLFRNINTCLSKIPLFQDLSAVNMQKLKLGLHYHSLDKDEVLFFEGEPGSEYYIVYSGTLDVTQYSPQNDGQVVLKTLKPGDSFGEIALLLAGVPRTATVRAKEKSLVLSLDEHTFRTFIRVAQLDMNVLMRKEILNTFDKCGIPFFAGIPKEELARACKIETYDKDTVIFKEGDLGDKFYMISHGCVAAMREEKTLKELERGDYFGEVALVVDETARTATCKATMPTMLLSISKKGFQTFFAGRPEALAEVELKIAGSKCRLKPILYHKMGLELFTEHLKVQMAEETIEFWKSVRNYRKLDADGDELQEKAESICKDYIGDTAKTQVNLSADMVEKIQRDIADGNANNTTFRDAESEAVSLLADKLAGFKRSEAFAKFLKSVGGYEVGDKMKKPGAKQRRISHLDGRRPS